MSNGHTLRLLRDASSLTKQSYVEFDLDDIFDNQRYADFRLFFLTVHASRFTPIAAAVATRSPRRMPTARIRRRRSRSSGHPSRQKAAGWNSGAPPPSPTAPAPCDALRDGVAVALTHLGTGFVSHPGNSQLRAMLAGLAPTQTKTCTERCYASPTGSSCCSSPKTATCCTPPAATPKHRHLYARLLLHRAAPPPGHHPNRHPAHRPVGRPPDRHRRPRRRRAATPGAARACRHPVRPRRAGVLAGAALPNRSLLAAVRALSQIDDPRPASRGPVDYRNLDSEELGGVYEGLLAYTPRYDADGRTFTLDDRRRQRPQEVRLLLHPIGPDRPRSGRSTRPTHRRSPAAHPTRKQALLGLTVVDPACRQRPLRRRRRAPDRHRPGHRPHRRHRTRRPQALRAATADVIERCIYGVDLNDLAIEITKVALWLEAFDGARPFPFLDAHLKVGNALLGTTPALLRETSPTPRSPSSADDDKDWTSKLKARNKAERDAATPASSSMFDTDTLDVETAALTKQARELDDTPRVPPSPQVAPAPTLGDASKTTPNSRQASSPPTPGAPHSSNPRPARATGQGSPTTRSSEIVENPDSVPTAVLDDSAQIWPGSTGSSTGTWSSPGSSPSPSQDGERRSRHRVAGRVLLRRRQPAVGAREDPGQGVLRRTSAATISPNAKTAAIRTAMIDALGAEDPPCTMPTGPRYAHSDGTAHLLLHSGRYPLTGQGDVNTYSVFAETFRTITAPTGAAGIITPTGLATDKTTAPFFADTLSSKRLIAFYDFENEAKIFRWCAPPVPLRSHRHGGRATGASRERGSPSSPGTWPTCPTRRFELAADEVLALNPNTGTLPMFRTRTDADITLGIYRRHPVLIRDGEPTAIPGGCRSARLFHMANDSGLFHQPDDLADADFNGWSYDEASHEYLPLYEAKMLGHFDHRFSTYRDATQAQLNEGSLPRPTASNTTTRTWSLWPAIGSIGRSHGALAGQLGSWVAARLA